MNLGFASGVATELSGFSGQWQGINTPEISD